MKRTSIIFLALVIAVVSGAVFGQFPQMKRAEERRQAMIAADEERQRAEKEGKATPVAPRPVLNVDVQMVLTKLEYKTFAEAKPFAANRIADGDVVWLYVKFNGKLERYVHTMHAADGSERYVLFIDFGPQGDITAKGHELIEFDKSELALSELKFSLAPGRAGHNKALSIFYRFVAASRPGLWNNELRLASLPAFPRAPNDYLATVGFTNDFSKGIVKYPAAKTAFRSMLLRDTTDESTLPIAGKFDNTTARTDLVHRLASEGIAPSKVYFSDDFWHEYSDLPTSTRQFRSTTGIFLYRVGAACFYGTADLTQTYDSMNDRFGESKIEIKKDIPTRCVQ